jgi:hypothetical protein
MNEIDHDHVIDIDDVHHRIIEGNFLFKINYFRFILSENISDDHRRKRDRSRSSSNHKSSSKRRRLSSDDDQHRTSHSSSQNGNSKRH